MPSEARSIQFGSLPNLTGIASSELFGKHRPYDAIADPETFLHSLLSAKASSFNVLDTSMQPTTTEPSTEIVPYVAPLVGQTPKDKEVAENSKQLANHETAVAKG